MGQVSGEIVSNTVDMTTNHIDPDDVVSLEPSERPNRFDVVAYTEGGTPFTLMEGVAEDIGLLCVVNLRGALSTYTDHFMDNQGAVDRGWRKAT